MKEIFLENGRTKHSSSSEFWGATKYFFSRKILLLNFRLGWASFVLGHTIFLTCWSLEPFASLFISLQLRIRFLFIMGVLQFQRKEKMNE